MGWTREPLVHFAVLGTGLFLLHAALVPAEPAGTILVDTELLATQHAARTGAAPSAAQTPALVEDYVEAEALYREALALGLDRHDAIIRRRLVQKMELVLERTGGLDEPTDDALQALLDASPERFGSPALVSLEHAYLRAGPQVVQRAAALREGLIAGHKTIADGDPFLRGATFAGHTEADIAKKLGAPLASAVMDLEPGRWSTPIASPYGLHVVRVSHKSAASAATLEQARAKLRDRWLEDARAERRRSAITSIVAKYEVATR